MDLIKNSFNKLFYHPVRGRIFYDLFITFTIGCFLLLNFYLFDNKHFNLFIPLIYTLIFLVVNFALGIYGEYKSTSLRNKSLILLCSNSIAAIFLILTTNEILLISLFFVFNILLTVLPRFFLNFNIERFSFKEISKTYQKEAPILVVGGGGFIGSTLVEELLKRNYKVRVFDKFIYNKDVFNNIKNKNNLELIEGDISDIYQLTLAVNGSSMIIHLAGIVGDPAAKIDEKLTRHVNIASTRLLKETAKAFGVKRFIFASSCSVYGYSEKIQTEKSKLNPISLYAKTKIDSEKELLSDTTDNFHPVILRFATVFGHSRKPRFDLVVNLFSAQAYTKQEIKVEGGDQWRPFIHVKDIARAIISSIEAPIESVSRQIFNVGDNEMNFKIIEVAEIAKNELKNKKVKILISNKKRDRRNYKVSFNKISKNLNFRASIKMDQGIKEIYKNFKNQKYKKEYTDSYYVNSKITKKLHNEFRTAKYKRTHFSSISDS